MAELQTVVEFSTRASKFETYRWTHLKFGTVEQNYYTINFFIIYSFLFLEFYLLFFLLFIFLVHFKMHLIFIEGPYF